MQDNLSEGDTNVKTPLAIVNVGWDETTLTPQAGVLHLGPRQRARQAIERRGLTVIAAGPRTRGAGRTPLTSPTLSVGYCAEHGLTPRDPNTTLWTTPARSIHGIRDGRTQNPHAIFLPG